MSTARTDVPVTPFHESCTCRSLQEILQHKQCARCHYLQAAEQTEADGFYVISHAFRFTAAQEAEQAAVLQGLLRSHGISAAPTAQAQPLPHSPLALLRTAAEHEHECYYIYNCILHYSPPFLVDLLFATIGTTREIPALVGPKKLVVL